MLTRRGTCDVLAAEFDDASFLRCAQTKERGDELLLAGAGNAGNADDLARVDVQIDALDTLNAVCILDTEVLDAQNGLARLGRMLIRFEHDLTSDHQVRQRVLVHLARQDVACHLAAAEDGYMVRDRKDLFELMRNKDDGLSVRCQIPNCIKQTLYAARRQNGRRLVKNDDICFLIEDLHNFDLLEHGDRQIRDFCIEGDVEVVLLTDLLDTLAAALTVNKQAAALLFLEAHDDVVKDGQVIKEHKLLIDHADAVLCSIQ